jgi:hypothetical protein
VSGDRWEGGKAKDKDKTQPSQRGEVKGGEEKTSRRLRRWAGQETTAIRGVQNAGPHREQHPGNPGEQKKGTKGPRAGKMKNEKNQGRKREEDEKGRERESGRAAHPNPTSWGFPCFVRLDLSTDEGGALVPSSFSIAKENETRGKIKGHTGQNKERKFTKSPFFSPSTAQSQNCHSPTLF